MADRGRVGSLIVGCKSGAQKQWRKDHESHRERIKTVQPASDMTAPVTMAMNHFRTNLKRERLLEDRYMEIDRENGILLKKMSQAMKKPNAYVVKDDNEKKPSASLNRQSRKVDLQRITHENKRMLKAIQQIKPVYDTKKWEDNYRKSEVLLKNCSSYPVITRLPREKSAPSILMSIEPEPAGAGLTGGSTSFGADQDDKKFVLKEGMRIGEKYFLLEMQTDGRALTISAYDGDSQSSMELVLKEKKHRQLYRELNGDYSQMASRLRVEGDRLVVD